MDSFTIKPLNFWKGNLAVWFDQTEGQFDSCGISNVRTKNFLIISAFDTDILTKVSDIVQLKNINNRLIDFDILNSILLKIKKEF